ncbi:unnamed protein product [Ixodes pacificus]
MFDSRRDKLGEDITPPLPHDRGRAAEARQRHASGNGKKVFRRPPLRCAASASEPNTDRPLKPAAAAAATMASTISATETTQSTRQQRRLNISTTSESALNPR